MPRYLLKLSFDGTDYCGWQVQPNGVSVQQKLQDCLESLFGTRPCVTGCSRTDSGVHANEFFCHFDLENFVPEKGVVKGLNSVLPKDIRVLNCFEVSLDFHCRYDALGKTYIYRIDTSDIQSPFEKRYSYNCTMKINLEVVNMFCEKIVGTKDFCGFSSSKRTVTDTVRTVKECFAVKNENIIEIHITADGFLYNMVRIIAGTALAFGVGRFDIADIDNIINSKDRAFAGQTLPPNGLFLNKVYYSGDAEYAKI